MSGAVFFTRVQSVLPNAANTPAKRRMWWKGLEAQWRQAFNEAVLGARDAEAEPSDAELEQLWMTEVFRFAGPGGTCPNMSIELDNLSGITGMTRIETLIVTNHRLQGIREAGTLPQLKGLFVYHNAITSLSGIEHLDALEQLYIQDNLVEDFRPLENLHNLRELYANANAIRSLKGLNRQHAKKLKHFYCLPNDRLLNREIARVEQALGIRCRVR